VWEELGHECVADFIAVKHVIQHQDTLTFGVGTNGDLFAEVGSGNNYIKFKHCLYLWLLFTPSLDPKGFASGV
jgi:hypothetical protein